MIEINLLPPEYRHVERAPLAAVIGTITGLALIGCLAFYLVLLKSQTATAQALLLQKQDELRDAELRAKEVERAEQEKRDAEQRLNNIKTLARQRVPWGLKLAQLQGILHQASPDFWVTRITLQPFEGTQKLAAELELRGSDEAVYTRALEFFHTEHNFIHHFTNSRTFRINKVKQPEGMVPDWTITTRVEFVVKPLGDRR